MGDGVAATDMAQQARVEWEWKRSDRRFGLLFRDNRGVLFRHSISFADMTHAFACVVIEAARARQPNCRLLQLREMLPSNQRWFLNAAVRTHFPTMRHR